jgi:hypothetical protein
MQLPAALDYQAHHSTSEIHNIETFTNLRNRVVFDRNLIDCLNLRVQQKQKAKKAKENHRKAKAVAVLPKPKTHAMLMQMPKPKTPMQCNANTRNAVLYDHLGSH